MTASSGVSAVPEPEYHFPAPWSRALYATTALMVVVLAVVMAAGLLFQPPVGNGAWLASMIGLPLVILAVTPFFAVRGYIVRGDQLIVKRLGWSTTVVLNGLTSVRADPNAMRRAWRTFGNGGAYGYSGYYRNKTLGNFRVFATDFSRAVVLKYDEDVPVVVTPGHPEAFVERVRRYARE